MNCADVETLICDYQDGTLTAERKSAVERHLAQCPACAELARDSAAAVEFMERAADVEPPPELITRILFEAPWSKDKRKPKGARSWMAGILGPILQPRFAMGMAMTVLSLALLARFMAPVRQLRMSDLEPAEVWAGIEDRAYRAWGRTVKFYDNLKFVYQIQTTLREWQQQGEDQQSAPVPEAPEGKTDEHKLPVKATPEQRPSGPGATGAATGGGPASNPTGGSR
jgi:Putative zinc-finger